MRRGYANLRKVCAVLQRLRRIRNSSQTLDIRTKEFSHHSSHLCQRLALSKGTTRASILTRKHQFDPVEVHVFHRTVLVSSRTKGDPVKSGQPQICLALAAQHEREDYSPTDNIALTEQSQCHYAKSLQLVNQPSSGTDLELLPCK